MGIMGKKMETTIRDIWGLFGGYIGIMHNNMETPMYRSERITSRDFAR